MLGLPKDGGCPVVVAQWQSTGSVPPSDCRPFHFPVFHLETSKISILVAIS